MCEFETGKRPMIRQRAGHSRALTALRQIRTTLQFLNIDDPTTVLMATSVVPDEGKTAKAIHFALVLARSGQRLAWAGRRAKVQDDKVLARLLVASD